jgi:hypothetical protein
MVYFDFSGIADSLIFLCMVLDFPSANEVDGHGAY